MFVWALVLLVINIAFMGGILYILLFRRGGGAPPPIAHTGTAEIEKLRTEIGEIRRAASALGSEIKRTEAGCAERKAAFGGGAANVGQCRGVHDEGRADDVYSRALKMYGSGVPVNEIARVLGLLNGEAELLCSLKRL